MRLCVLLLAGILVTLPACELGPEGQEDPRLSFFQHMRGFCGATFTGKVERAPPSDRVFSSAPLSLSFEECQERRLVLQFGVGEDDSRRWLLLLEEDGALQFLQGRKDPGMGMKTEDTWGGWAEPGGDAFAHAFPDPRTGRYHGSIRDRRVWRLHLDLDQSLLTYHLDRGGTNQYLLVFHPTR